ncbi:hypothetical protein PybrP1_009766 [[Pythium] brassicae (nom. inval.)]|nr:hypothetical protein PybrP1_009766 [[Pythium] brassicae (nom. inval.)]
MYAVIFYCRFASKAALLAVRKEFSAEFWPTYSQYSDADIYNIDEADIDMLPTRKRATVIRRTVKAYQALPCELIAGSFAKVLPVCSAQYMSCLAFVDGFRVWQSAHFVWDQRGIIEYTQYQTPLPCINKVCHSMYNDEAARAAILAWSRTAGGDVRQRARFPVWCALQMSVLDATRLEKHVFSQSGLGGLMLHQSRENEKLELIHTTPHKQVGLFVCRPVYCEYFENRTLIAEAEGLAFMEDK